MNEIKLPKGWTLVEFSQSIKEIALARRKLKKREYLRVGILPVIDQGKKFIGGFTNRVDLKISDKPVIIFGDHTKVIKYIDFEFVAGADGVKVIKPLDCFYPKLFYYFLHSVELPEKGYHRHFQYLKIINLPLPPLAEQHRIVAKIEKLFTKLDAGIEALKKAKEQIKRYRQAVLKYAFEGKLTEQWRARVKQLSPNEYEPASVLLEKIKRAKANNHSPTKGKKQKELPPIDTSQLPKLPEDWVWVRLGEIGEIITGTTPSKSKKEYYGDDYPFFKPTDLNAGYYVKKSEDGLSKKGIERARLLPIKTILVTCIGATIGKAGFTRVEGASNQQINAIIPAKFVLPEFVYFACISPQFQKLILENASATTLPIINKNSFENLSFPLSPLLEQREIVSEIERRFSVADEVEKVIDNSLKQAERLRQSILKKAFEGKLVPQDPSDEPAEKLLERIKQSKGDSTITHKNRNNKIRKSKKSLAQT